MTESFVAQYLSPKLMRDFRLFAILDDDSQETLKIEAIHNELGYRSLRQIIADQYNLGSIEPDIQVWNVDLRGDRSLTLRHTRYQGRPHAESQHEVMRHVASLWGFIVRLEEQDENGVVRTLFETSPGA